jgi:hypothetical protein
LLPINPATPVTTTVSMKEVYSIFNEVAPKAVVPSPLHTILKELM